MKNARTIIMVLAVATVGLTLSANAERSNADAVVKRNDDLVIESFQNTLIEAPPQPSQTNLR